MLTVYQGTDQPGIEKTTLTATSSGASPSATTFTLPAQGVYDVVIVGRASTSNHHRGIVTARVTWYSYQSNGSTWLRKTSELSNVVAGNVSAIAASDPTTGGVVTVTLTFTGGGNTAVTAILRRVMSQAELETV